MESSLNKADNKTDTLAETLIEVKDLYFSYGEKTVLENINFCVDKGTIVSIIGPNGGGKTTLLKIILGLLKGYKGLVKVNCMVEKKNGRSTVFHHSCIGYVSQRSKINMQFPASIKDVVEMGLYGMTGFRGPSSLEKDYIERLLLEVGVENIKNRPINAVSGGQMQRTLIARALVGKPSILLLDEPLVGIDQKGIIQFLELIMKIRDQLGLTVVMVTHDIHSATIFSDKIACLNRFIHFHDNPEKMSREDLTKTFVCNFEALLSLDQQKTIGKK